jgi:hypothetical protein
MWIVKFEGEFLPKTIRAATFLEAVAIAAKTSEAIVSVEYLAY